MIQDIKCQQDRMQEEIDIYITLHNIHYAHNTNREIRSSPIAIWNIHPTFGIITQLKALQFDQVKAPWLTSRVHARFFAATYPLESAHRDSDKPFLATTALF